MMPSVGVHALGGLKGKEGCDTDTRAVRKRDQGVTVAGDLAGGDTHTMHLL